MRLGLTIGYSGATIELPMMLINYDLICRYGYEEAAAAIQDLYLRDKKMEAVIARRSYYGIL